MKLTMEQAATVREALRQLQTKELSFKQSYWIGKILSRLEVPLKPFDEVRERAVKEFGESDGQGWKIATADGCEKYMNAMKEVVLDEVEVDIRLLKLEQFEDVTLTGLVADTLLRYVFEEGEEMNGTNRDVDGIGKD